MQKEAEVKISFRRQPVMTEGMKRRKVRIGIVRNLHEGDISHIDRQLGIYLANSMKDQYDVLPVLVSPMDDADVRFIASEHGCKSESGDSYDFLWAFWDGSNRMVSTEIARAAKAGRKVIIFSTNA